MCTCGARSRAPCRAAPRGSPPSRTRPEPAPRPTARCSPISAPARLLMGTQQQHLEGMRVRRSRLGEAVVAVVPDRHQAEVANGREGRRSGAEHDLHDAARQPRGRRGSGRPGRGRRSARRSASGPTSVGQRRLDPRDVVGVGDADDGCRARRSGSRRRRRRADSPSRPPVARSRRARATPPALSRVRNAAPPTSSAQSSVSVSSGRSITACAGRRLLGLDPGVTRRHGQPEHVGQRAGVPVGDRSGEQPAPPEQARARPTPPAGSAPAHRRGRSSPIATTTKPSTSRPANRTLTRQPGTTSSCMLAGTW